MSSPKRHDDPLQGLGTTRRAFVVPDLKIMYFSLAKNACTSMKWMIAELAGEDTERFRPALGFLANRETGIHDRESWQHTPRLSDLSPEDRMKIHPDNGWFVFSVLRDPRSRLFSAWQDKYLLRSPAYRNKWLRPWAPRIPSSPKDVTDDFARFVASRLSDPDHEAFKDPHFMEQTFLLAEHLVPYSHLYDVSQLTSLKTDLSAHLVRQGHSGRVTIKRFNDAPLSANGALYEGGVREAIEAIYASDFARFGDLWDFDRIESRAMDWTDASIAHVASVISSNQRITDLAVAAQRLEKRNERLQATNRELHVNNRRLRRTVRRQRSRINELNAASKSLASRLLRRLKG
jgi:Sulfotransferase family